MATELDRIEEDIQRTESKVAEFQKQLRELGTQKTEQENSRIIRLVRDMSMKPEESTAFLHSSTIQATPAATLYRKQEDNAHEE